VSASGSDPISQFLEGLSEPGQLATLAGESASLRFDVDDGGAVRHWYLTVTDGVVSTGQSGVRPDAIVRVGRAELEAMVTGRLNAQAAILRGLLTCEGSMAALIMFQRCLPGPPGSAGRVDPVSGAVVMAQRRAG
jgi:SCP-2 sterol transfer family